MKISLIFIVVIVFLSCGQKQFDSKEDLLEYLENEDNGYIQKKTVNGVDFSLMYRPTDLILSQILESEIANDVDRLRNKYEDFLYFNLSISIKNQELLNAVPMDRNEYGSMVNRLVFGMEDSVKLYTNRKDTIALVDYIYPRMYGLGNTTTMLFVFAKVSHLENTEYISFTLNNLGLNTGEVKFKIDTERIKNQPSIQFKG